MQLRQHTTKVDRMAGSKLSVIAFDRLWISMPAVMVAVPAVRQNSLHYLSTSSITARHLLDFMVQGKITEAESPTIRMDATISELSVPPRPPSFIFTPNATLPIYPGLGQVPNNAGLHTQWLGYTVAWISYLIAVVKLCCGITGSLLTCMLLN